MSDCMDYPQTLRKFANDYAFKDSDEVYTNGSMLVPLFRIEQALDEHFMDIEKTQYIIDTDCAYDCGYQQGMKDKEKELKEHNVFVSNKPIEDIVLDAVNDERERIVVELEELRDRYDKYDFGTRGILEKAIEIVRGE